MFKIDLVRTRKLIVTCLAYGLILILFCIFVARPISGYSARLKSEIASQSQQIKEYDRLIRTFPNPEKKIEDIEKKVQELKAKEAGREQIPHVIQQLARKTHELNINTISIKPRQDIKPTKEKLIQGVSKVYIEIVMLSSYQVVCDYLKALAELPTILSVENLSIEKKQESSTRTGSSGANELLVTLLLSSYMYGRDTGG